MTDHVSDLTAVRLLEMERIVAGLRRTRLLLESGAPIETCAESVEALAARARKVGSEDAATIADSLLDTIHRSAAWRHVERQRYVNRSTDRNPGGRSS